MDKSRKLQNFALVTGIGCSVFLAFHAGSVSGQPYQQQVPAQAAPGQYEYMAGQAAPLPARSAVPIQYRLPLPRKGAAFEWPAPTSSDLVVTTSPSVDGFKITHYRGLVEGVAVREPTGTQDFAAQLQGMFAGGHIDAYGQLCEQGRVQAYNNLQNRAKGMGANAVIAVRFDNETISMGKGDFATAVVCYGTAVVVEPLAAGTK
jgi:uncharacterized protein YbjQ (UPF0145 family)